MDEVGRGTGTRDGLAIAWAVCLTILERVRARTLFATHFHELTGLRHPRVANLSMDVLERAGEVIFLKRVRPGPSDNSYGLHVAKLAGLPDETLAWAGEVLARLVAGAEKAKSVLGWKPKHGELQAIVQHAWNWHKAHPNGYSK